MPYSRHLSMIVQLFKGCPPTLLTPPQHDCPALQRLSSNPQPLQWSSRRPCGSWLAPITMLLALNCPDQLMHEPYGHADMCCVQYPLCMELLTCGQIDLSPMVSHRFPFDAEGMLEGFKCAQNADQTKAIKVMFQILP